ncbi:MAG: TenA family transcriptional regulator [Solirubrobacterales bacterium]
MPVRHRPEGDDVMTIWQRIDQARGRWDVLQHPFYLRWSAGELSREELADYAGQYRHATEAIARLSRQAAEAAPAPERAELARHAAEEADHVALWDGFVSAVGGQIGAEPIPETRDCVAAWTADGDLLTSLARLFAIESAQPEIARVKREGLADFYGVGDGDGNAYFRVHEGLDVEHAEAGRELIERHLEGADEDALVGAAESAFRANWRLLDGVDGAGE